MTSSPLVRLFLTSYPLIPATTNFIIYHVVCQRNIRAIFNFPEKSQADSFAKNVGAKLGILLVSSLLPVLITSMRFEVGFIFSVSGAFTTIFSSWCFPTLMVYKSRKMLSYISVKNPHSSPFTNNFWVYSVLIIIFLTFISNIIVLINP